MISDNMKYIIFPVISFTILFTAPAISFEGTATYYEPPYTRKNLFINYFTILLNNLLYIYKKIDIY